MLEGMFFEYKKNFELLKDCSIKINQISYIYHQIIIENKENLITIDMEGYGDILGGVLFYNKRFNSYFYTLADYSYIKGAKDVFDVVTSISKQDFYKDVRSSFVIRHFRKNLYNYNLVHSIYNLIEEFIMLSI